MARLIGSLSNHRSTTMTDPHHAPSPALWWGWISDYPDEGANVYEATTHEEALRLTAIELADGDAEEVSVRLVTAAEVMDLRERALGETP